MGWGEVANAFVYTIDNERREVAGAPSAPVVSESSVKGRELEVSWRSLGTSSVSSNYGPIRYFTIEMREIEGDGGGGGGGGGLQLDLVNKKVSGWRSVVERYYVDSSEDSYKLKVSGNDGNGEWMMSFYGYFGGKYYIILINQTF